MGTDVLVILLIVLGIVVIWRGPKTLPKLASALGRGVKVAKTEASRKMDDDEPPADPDASRGS
jgi:Sec-independent protein translocase protein TatA